MYLPGETAVGSAKLNPLQVASYVFHQIGKKTITVSCLPQNNILNNVCKIFTLNFFLNYLILSTLRCENFINWISTGGLDYAKSTLLEKMFGD